jgi:short-subunit dehydrogenase
MKEKIDIKQRYGAGSWVVISGATNPLGQEFLRQFNNKGFNVVIMDQDEELL